MRLFCLREEVIAAMTNEEIEYIRPQPKQEEFLSSKADIAVYGGAAGGGKTWSLLFDGWRLELMDGNAAGVLFKKEANQIKGPGNIWEAAEDMYGTEVKYNQSNPPRITFESGAAITFSHMSTEDRVNAIQGGELAWVAFEELVQEKGFSERQFRYALGRMRTKARWMDGPHKGQRVRPRCKATCNPIGTPHWFRDNWLLPGGYIYPHGHKLAGYAVPEMSGVIQFFLTDDAGRNHFARTKEELWAKFPHKRYSQVHVGQEMPLQTFTFISASLADNQFLDASYEANLQNQTPTERKALLEGNWFVTTKMGDMFPRDKVTLVDEVPIGNGIKLVEIVRGNDLAATEKDPNDIHHDPDFTAGVTIGKLSDGRIIFLDCQYGTYNPSTVIEKLIQWGLADIDYCRTLESKQLGAMPMYRFMIPQDPAAAGKLAAEVHLTALNNKGVPAFAKPVGRTNKRTNALPLSAKWHTPGQVICLRREWTEDFLMYMNFFDGHNELYHDDIPDGASLAYNTIVDTTYGWEGY